MCMFLFPLTNAVLVNLDGSVVHFSHGLHLKVVAIAMIRSLAINILFKILSHKLREIVSILQLETGNNNNV